MRARRTVRKVVAVFALAGLFSVGASFQTVQAQDDSGEAPDGGDAGIQLDFSDAGSLPPEVSAAFGADEGEIGPDVGINSVSIGGASHDSTVLTQFVPGAAFVESITLGDQLERSFSNVCIQPSASSLGSVTEAYAPVHLPDGSLITGFTIFADDDDATAGEDIDVFLRKVTVSFAGLFGGTTSITNTTVATASTSDAPSITAVFADVDPDEVTGSSGSILFGTSHTFYMLQFSADNASTTLLDLCGVEVFYQPSSDGTNQVLTPIAPCAIFDSRITSGGTGSFAADETRTVDVIGDTTGIGGTADCGISPLATALQVNILILDPLGTGTFKAWEGGGVEPAGLVAFNTDTTRWNGSSIVPVALDDTMSLKFRTSGGDVRLVATGYFSSVANMGN